MMMRPMARIMTWTKVLLHARRERKRVGMAGGAAASRDREVIGVGGGGVAGIDHAAAVDDFALQDDAPRGEISGEFAERETVAEFDDFGLDRRGGDRGHRPGDWQNGNGVMSRTRRRTGPLPAGSEGVVGARKQAIRRAILRSSSASL